MTNFRINFSICTVGTIYFPLIIDRQEDQLNNRAGYVARTGQYPRNADGAISARRHLCDTSEPPHEWSTIINYYQWLSPYRKHLLGTFWVHLDRSWSVVKYSVDHRRQKAWWHWSSSFHLSRLLQRASGVDRGGTANNIKKWPGVRHSKSPGSVLRHTKHNHFSRNQRTRSSTFHDLMRLHTPSAWGSEQHRQDLY